MGNYIILGGGGGGGQCHKELFPSCNSNPKSRSSSFYRRVLPFT